MPDNLHPCPHCNGTGEIRTGWFAVHQYQDGSDIYGPYDSQAEAQKEHGESGYGVMVTYEERELS